MGLGSGIREKPVPDPGSKRHKIPDPDPQHCQSATKHQYCIPYYTDWSITILVPILVPSVGLFVIPV